MKHVIHNPKVDWSHWDEQGLKALQEVMNECDTFLTAEDEGQAVLQEQAKNEWDMWRLVMDGVISFDVARYMTPDEIAEANAALDLMIEAKNKANQKGGK
ncbi:hypothetical protein ACEQPO_08075 [Bacillus sp. SL00103]